MTAHQWLGKLHTACKCTSGHKWINANHSCGCAGGGAKSSTGGGCGKGRSLGATASTASMVTSFAPGAHRRRDTAIHRSPSRAAVPFVSAAARPPGGPGPGSGSNSPSGGSSWLVPGSPCCCVPPSDPGGPTYRHERRSPAAPSTPGPHGPATGTRTGPSTPGPGSPGVPAPEGPSTPWPNRSGRGGGSARKAGPTSPPSYYRCVPSQRHCEFCGTQRSANCHLSFQECLATCRGQGQSVQGGSGGATRSAFCPAHSFPYERWTGCPCPGVVNSLGMRSCAGAGRCCCCPDDIVSSDSGLLVYEFKARFGDIPKGIVVSDTLLKEYKISVSFHREGIPPYEDRPCDLQVWERVARGGQHIRFS